MTFNPLTALSPLDGRYAGKVDALRERLFAGYFQRGEDLGDTATLHAMAHEQGLKTQDLQAWLLSGYTSELAHVVEPGPSPAIRFPGDGPYDERLGYHRLPEWTRKLGEQGYVVSAQARMSETQLGLIDSGLFTIYAEKDQAGLDLADCDAYIGVSAGGFIAAGLANGITSRMLAVRDAITGAADAAGVPGIRPGRHFDGLQGVGQEFEAAHRGRCRRHTHPAGRFKFGQATQQLAIRFTGPDFAGAGVAFHLQGDIEGIAWRDFAVSSHHHAGVQANAHFQFGAGAAQGRIALALTRQQRQLHGHAGGQPGITFGAAWITKHHTELVAQRADQCATAHQRGFLEGLTQGALQTFTLFETIAVQAITGIPPRRRHRKGAAQGRSPTRQDRKSGRVTARLRNGARVPSQPPGGLPHSGSS